MLKNAFFIILEMMNVRMKEEILYLQMSVKKRIL